jgi:hypothetical protein
MIVKIPKAGGPGQSGDLDSCAHGGPDQIRPSLFSPALAVPAAASMEAPGYAVAETTGVGEPYTMIETATYAVAEAATYAMAEAATKIMIEAASHAMAEVSAEAGDTCSMIGATSHAMTEAVAEFAVATIVGAVGAVGWVSVVAKIIGLVSVARQGTAVSRVVHIPRRAGVPVGVGLRSSRLRSSNASHGQPNTASQQGRFNREFAAGHRSLLFGDWPHSLNNSKVGNPQTRAMGAQAALTVTYTF